MKLSRLFLPEDRSIASPRNIVLILEFNNGRSPENLQFLM
jgi:hypothetical protein